MFVNLNSPVKLRMIRNWVVRNGGNNWSIFFKQLFNYSSYKFLVSIFKYHRNDRHCSCKLCKKSIPTNGS